MEPTHAGHLHHTALARWLHISWLQGPPATTAASDASAAGSAAISLPFQGDFVCFRFSDSAADSEITNENASIHVSLTWSESVSQP